MSGYVIGRQMQLQQARMGGDPQPLAVGPKHAVLADGGALARCGVLVQQRTTEPWTGDRPGLGGDPLCSDCAAAVG